jgi:hypothetical protein
MAGEHLPETTDGAADEIALFTGKRSSGRYWARTSDLLLVREGPALRAVVCVSEKACKPSNITLSGRLATTAGDNRMHP